MLKYEVTELYHSFSGEAPTVGQLALFIRLRGCLLKCKGCDTQKAFLGGVWESLTAKGIFAKEVTFDPFITPKLVVITGGEPLLWNLDTIFRYIEETGRISQVETSGAYPFLGTLRPDILVCSPKRRAHFNIHLDILDSASIFKIVYGPEGSDFQASGGLISHLKILGKQVYLMPYGSPPSLEECRRVAEAAISMEVNYSPRIHFGLGVR